MCLFKAIPRMCLRTSFKLTCLNRSSTLIPRFYVFQMAKIRDRCTAAKRSIQAEWRKFGEEQPRAKKLVVRVAQIVAAFLAGVVCTMLCCCCCPCCC